MTFLVYRWIVACFFIFSVAYAIAINIICGSFSTFFIYWTHLNLCGTMIATVLGAILVTLHHFDKLQVENIMPTSLKIYWALWNQSIGFACMISVFYWSFIHEGKLFELNNVLIHITNLAVLIVDAYVIKFPARYKNFFYVTFIGVCYGIFTILYQQLGLLNK